MSYSHICMQHHVPEADGRGFYGVCVFGMPSCDCTDTRLNIQHKVLNLIQCINSNFSAKRWSFGFEFKHV